MCTYFRDIYTTRWDCSTVPRMRNQRKHAPSYTRVCTTAICTANSVARFNLYAYTPSVQYPAESVVRFRLYTRTRLHNAQPIALYISGYRRVYATAQCTADSSVHLRPGYTLIHDDVTEQCVILQVVLAPQVVHHRNSSSPHHIDNRKCIGASLFPVNLFRDASGFSLFFRRVGLQCAISHIASGTTYNRVKPYICVLGNCCILSNYC